MQADPKYFNQAPDEALSLKVLESTDPEHTPVDGIEILVNLAKTGKIDPWNIDIVKLSDEYLAALKDMTTQNLKLTGKTILLAAILLRMKSDKMTGIDYWTLPGDEIEDNDLSDWDGEPEAYWNSSDAPMAAVKNMTLDALNTVFNKLDNLLGRRTSTKEPRKRRVTLEDLIREVRHYEELERKRSLKEAVEKVDRRRLSRRYENLDVDEIIDLAHDEFIEDTVFKLKTVLEAFFNNNQSISFEDLTRDCGLDKVSAFVALLFLASRGEVDLHQEGFYQPLYVRPYEEAERDVDFVSDSAETPDVLAAHETLEKAS
jgi:segregation and condensation protein A